MSQYCHPTLEIFVFPRQDLMTASGGIQAADIGIGDIMHWLDLDEP